MVYGLLTRGSGTSDGDGVTGVDIGVIIGVATLAITVISSTVGGILALAGQLVQPEPKETMPAGMAPDLVKAGADVRTSLAPGS